MQSVNNAARPSWKNRVTEILNSICIGNTDIDSGLAAMQECIDTATAESLK